MRNVAEYLDATREGRTPHLGPGSGDGSESNIPATCKALQGCGTLDLAVGGRPPITLKCQSKSTSDAAPPRSEEHTSELQSLMRISYAVFCLKKKTKQKI